MSFPEERQVRRVGRLSGHVVPKPVSSAGGRLLEGVRVVELATMIAAPSAVAMLADHGADVIKIERPGGDTWRSAKTMFVQDNRGKRSVCLDLHQAAGMQFFLKLLDTSDVFVTNVRPKALAKLGIDYSRIQSRCPRLVYAVFTAYGMTGPVAEKPGYDAGAFWARTGLMDLSRANDTDALQARYPGGNGDHTAALGLLAGIFGALFHASRTGAGQFVEANLLHTGLWTMATPIAAWSGMQSKQFRTPRTSALNPCYTNYVCKDGLAMQLLGQQPARHFLNQVTALGIADQVLGTHMDVRRWLSGEVCGDALATARREIVARCDAAFRTKTREEWVNILEAAGVWFEKVQTFEEALEDPQAAAIGAFADPGLGYKIVNSPMTFSCHEHGPQTGAPECGQHNTEVAVQLGYSSEQAAALVASGVLTTAVTGRRLPG